MLFVFHTISYTVQVWNSPTCPQNCTSCHHICLIKLNSTYVHNNDVCLYTLFTSNTIVLPYRFLTFSWTEKTISTSVVLLIQYSANRTGTATATLSGAHCIGFGTCTCARYTLSFTGIEVPLPSDRTICLRGKKSA